MYKLLLSSRYLRTRFIALASIISVTLGVATMIVVNSVMSGFSGQMKDRIHGILADLMLESISTDGTPSLEGAGGLSPRELMERVEQAAGDYIVAMTPTVEMYGMMSFDFHGQKIHQPVTLIGILPDGKNQVSPFGEFLQSRQTRSNGDAPVAPERSLDEPLDWELTPSAIASRHEWREWQKFRAQLNAERAIYERDAGSPEPIVRTEGAAPVEPPDGETNPFAASGDESGADVLAADAAASPMSPTDIFGGPATGAAADPDAPLKARCYVGSTLISFPHIDRKTGKSETLMMLEPGQDVVLSTVKAGKQPTVVGFSATVVDVFKSGMSEYDSNLVFCNLEELQFARAMLDPRDRGDWSKGAITTLQIRLKDYADAPIVIERLRQLPELQDFRLRTWEQKQGPLLEAVEVESAILNVLLFLIVAVAGFGILAIFYMIVVEKTKDIGILKALGASSRGVMTIFLSYGLALGVVGSGAGVVLGLLFVHYINEIEDFISWLTGHKVFDETIYYFQEIPTAVHPMMVVWVSLGAIAIAVLASVLPARRASRLHPVQALRYE